MTEQTNDRRSLGLFIASMLIFGTIGVFRRFIPLPSALLAFARGILGGLFLMVFVKLRNGFRRSPSASAGPRDPASRRSADRAQSKRGGGEKPAPRVMLRLVITGAMIGVNWMLLFEAYNYTTVAVATLCYYMQPAIVILLSPLVFRERLTGKKALCAVVSIAGMVLVSGVIGSGGQSVDMRGIALGLGAASFYAAVIILNKKTPGTDPYQRTTIMLLSAGIVMLPYLLLTGGFSGAGFSPTAVLLLLVLGIFHTGIAYAMYFASMDGLRVQTIAVFSYIDPVSALLFSALLLKEPISALNVTGAVMIIGSAMISEL